MWYVIQTVTGKEEDLLLQLNALPGRERFYDCFIIRAEWLKRLGGKWETQVRPLFPGYVFVETGRPEELFLKLKETPAYTRLLGNGRYEFTAVEEEEEDFLKTICRAGQEEGGSLGFGKRWLVRLSTARPWESGEGWQIRGPLRVFEKQIERINLHKRYAVVRVSMGRREQTVLFGLAGSGEIEDDTGGTDEGDRAAGREGGAGEKGYAGSGGCI